VDLAALNSSFGRLRPAILHSAFCVLPWRRDGAPVSDPAMLKPLGHAGSETGVPVAQGRVAPPELTDCTSPVRFHPHRASLPFIPGSGEPASSDGKVFVPGPSLLRRKLCFARRLRVTLGRRATATNRTETPAELRSLQGRAGPSRAPSNARRTRAPGSTRHATGSTFVLNTVFVAGWSGSEHFALCGRHHQVREPDNGPGRRSRAELLGRCGQRRRRREDAQHASRHQCLQETVSLVSGLGTQTTALRAKKKRKVLIVGTQILRT
jgi:hypothetical protein